MQVNICFSKENKLFSLSNLAILIFLLDRYIYFALDFYLYFYTNRRRVDFHFLKKLHIWEKYRTCSKLGKSSCMKFHTQKEACYTKTTFQITKEKFHLSISWLWPWHQLYSIFFTLQYLAWSIPTSKNVTVKTLKQNFHIFPKVTFPNI